MRLYNSGRNEIQVKAYCPLGILPRAPAFFLRWRWRFLDHRCSYCYLSAASAVCHSFAVARSIDYLEAYDVTFCALEVQSNPPARCRRLKSVAHCEPILVILKFGLA